MTIITPTITATTPEDYKSQIEKVAHFAHRIHIDLTDGVFAERKTIAPSEAWWPAGVKADIHLMYQEPLEAVKTLLPHKPNLIIIHAESNGDFGNVARLCAEAKVKVGVALMPDTPAQRLASSLPQVDHAMIFSGNIGYQGGSTANLDLLEKVKTLRAGKSELEIGWDGGVNAQNVAQLVFGGVDVLNAGGFIQSATDPLQAYEVLQRIADETGTS